MTQLPPGQSPIDPLGALVPPPLPGQQAPASPPVQLPPGWPTILPFPVPQPRRGGAIRTALTLVTVLAMLGSLLLNLVWLSGGTGSDDALIVTQSVSKGNAAQSIAVVTLAGEINSETALRFDRVLDHIETEPSVRALVIEVDTPGGEVTASDEMYDRLLRYKQRRRDVGRSPAVVVSMKSMATSGGYYVACAGDYLVAEPTTLTGNIGVLMPRFNFSGLMEKYGVKETTVVATGADFKTVGSPFRPDSPEAEVYLRSRVDQAFDRFKQVVNAGRGSKVAGKDVFNGKVFTAAEALKLGLVDQVGYPDDAYAYAATSGGLTNPSVVRYREPSPGLLGMMLGGSSAQGNETGPSTATPSGNDLGRNLQSVVRPETLDAWRTTRLMYR